MVDPVENPKLTLQQKNDLAERVKVKPQAEIMKAFFDIQNDMESIKNDVDDPDNEEKIKIARDIPSTIKEKNKQKLLTNTEVVRETLIAIRNSLYTDTQGKSIQKDPLAIPSGVGRNILIQLVQKIDIDDINQGNAVYVNEVINKALTGGISDTQSVLQAFRSIHHLQYIDNNLYRSISESFQTIVLNDMQIGEDEKKNTVDKLKTQDQKKQEEEGDIAMTPEEIRRRREMLEGSSGSIESIILGINESNIEGSEMMREIERDLRGINEQEARTLEKTGGINNALNRVKNDLMMGLEHMRSPEDPNNIISRDDFSRGRKDFEDTIDKYYRQGVINSRTHDNLRQLANVYHKHLIENIQVIERFKGRDMEYIIQQNNVWNPSEQDLLRALDDPEKLRMLAETKYEGLTAKGWDKFQEDIEKIFDRLFDLAQARPDDFWQEAFSELHEGFAFKRIVQKLNNLSEDLQKNEYFRKKTVEMEDFVTHSDGFQIDESQGGVKQRLVGIRRKNRNFCDALSILAKQMIDAKKMVEYTHNINQISNLGLGFDKIAEYSARVSMRDVDKLFYKNYDLVEAYNFYLQNMYQEFSLNYHIMSTDFGLMGDNKMDKIEERTYKQLAAKYGKEILNDKHLIRMIKMASGLAKGVTGEYWGAAITARLPMKTETIYDAVNKKEVVHRMGNSFQSLQMPGLEKMLWTIDIDLLLQRFNLPRFWPELRYAFAPRDFDDERVRQKYYNFDHNDIYRYKKMGDTACFDGRPDELAEADEDYTFFHEHFRTSSIDYWLRGSWRFQEYREFLVPQYKNGQKKRDKNGNLVIDFEATMKRMQGIGPYIVKYFIDELINGTDYQKVVDKDDKKPLSMDSIVGTQDFQRLFPDYDPAEAAKWTKKQRDAFEKEKKIKFKEFLYKKYIFDRLSKNRLTQFIVMETPRYMPQGEARLSDRLELKLRDMFKAQYDNAHIRDHMLPMFIGAMELVENEMWRSRKEIWREKARNGDWTGKDVLDYEINEATFTNNDIRNKLINFLHLTQDQTGTLVEPGKLVYIRDEDFLNHVKEFYMCLHDEINNVKRMNRVVGGHTETLSERYAHMMRMEMGYIDHYLKGNLFDFSEFYLQQGGSRGSERAWGEVAGIATKGTPAMRQILVEAIPELVKKKYNNTHELEQAIGNVLAKPFMEWYNSIFAIDPEQALKDAKYLIAYISALVGKDRAFRTKIIGSAAQDFSRRMWGTQASFMIDHFKDVITRPTTAFDSEQIHALVHTLTNMINMPHDHEQIRGYKKNFLGINVPDEALAKHNLHSIEQIEETLGVTQVNRIKEAFPMVFPIALLILFILAKLALDKDKKKG